MHSLHPPDGTAFSVAERAAIALDGDGWHIADEIVPSDRVSTPALRAHAVGHRLHPALALCFETAAWVHGHAGLGSTVHVACRRDARADAGGNPRLAVHLLAYRPDQLVRPAGVPVTSLLRTAIDLLALRANRPTAVRALHAMAPHVPRDAIEASVDGQASTARRARIRRALAHLDLAWGAAVNANDPRARR